ncbi:MAG: hypothetical protein ACI9NQ_000887 [Paracoccaceae bacterium]
MKPSSLISIRFVLLALWGLTVSTLLGMPDKHLSPVRVFPGKKWKVSEVEAKEWSGPFASVLRVMLVGGLPDPVGLPYHRVTIITGNCYSGYDGETETEGWVMPQKEGGTPLVIAWNGLIYPIVADKGAADLGKSVARMMTAEDEAAWSDVGESTQTTFGNYSLIQGLYLTRLGFSEAAKHLLEIRERPLDPPSLKQELILQWIWNHYERAVCAHMRGDPRMALASLSGCREAMASLKQVVEKSEPERDWIGSWAKGLPMLGKECERRLKSGKLNWFNTKKFVEEKPSVQELVNGLARIALSQNGQPGDVPLWESLVVKALVAKGNDAMEPLLKCLENDERLTQSVHFWRSYHRSRTILGVHEAALYGLQSLLGANFFRLASTGDSLSSRDPGYRKKLAAVIRTEWEKYGKAVGVERSFRILKDDSAGIEAWWDAGATLFPREEYDEHLDEWVLPSGPIPGEPLREFKNPSVSDLFEKRAREAGQLILKDAEDAGRARLALLSMLLDWDEQRGKLAIEQLIKSWMKDQSWEREGVNVLVSIISEVIDQVPEVLAVFEAMAWKFQPDRYEAYPFHSGFVTKMHAAHRGKLKRKDLWTDPKSPWCLQKLELDALEDVVGCWREQKLVDQSPYRELVFRLLADDSTCGKIFIKKEEPKIVWLAADDGASGRELPEGAKVGLKPGEDLAVRRKDVVGRALEDSRYLREEKVELLEYYWPVKDRDKWLARIVAEITKKGTPLKGQEE